MRTLSVPNIVSKFQEDWIRFDKIIAVYKTVNRNVDDDDDDGIYGRYVSPSRHSLQARQKWFQGKDTMYSDYWPIFHAPLISVKISIFFNWPTVV